jgi:transcriptional regulator with XRE-family HTH domain
MALDQAHPEPEGAEAAFVQPELGRALRRLRQERELSLTDVATATGLSVSFLSVVEKGRSDIAIGRLMRIMRFYRVRVGDLVEERTPAAQLVVRRGEERRVRSQEGVDLYLLTADTDRAMMPVLTTYAPHARQTNLEPHDGETFVHILEGTLLLELAGQPPLVLRAGDTAYFKPNPAPTLTNLGDTPVRLVGAVTPPTL